jgi:phosphatidylcholine synthase
MIPVASNQPDETSPAPQSWPVWALTSAWAVHLFTATGAVVGLAAMIRIVQGQWLGAFIYMAIAIGIDSIDGAFARFFKVKQVLPQFDGSLLDNIVDYFTYVIVPAFFIYESGIVPHGLAMFSAAAITLASGYQFCQADAKTEDHYFKGFPSYWNVVIFYLFMLKWPGIINFLVLIFLTISVFVPVKYLYPSRTKLLQPLTLALSGVWGILLVIVLFQFNGNYFIPLYLSLLYVAYYCGMSVYLTFKTK